MPSLVPRLAQALWLISSAIAAILPAVGSLQQPSSCQRKCGEVDIPYPFGIGSADSPEHCARPGFSLSCNNSRVFLRDVEVLSISLEKSQARIRMDMSSDCCNTSTGTPYRFSDTGNLFTVIGCSTLAYIGDEDYAGNRRWWWTGLSGSRIMKSVQ